MSEELNKVETTVKVAGKDCFFVSLFLSQGFNRHHHFEITVNYEELDEKWMGSPVKMIQLIGEKVNITIVHRTSGEQILFEGLITNVDFSGYHGQQNDIIISGSSNTIKLDGKDTMDSFMDKPLKQVIEEAVGNSGNEGEVTAAPVYSQKLDYLCQYNETCFEFLNRLSWLYGEWFFNDGITTYFGKPKQDDPVEVIYDVHMTQFDMKAKLVPPKFNRYQYLVHDDNEIKHDAPPEVNGVRGYLQASLGRSDETYTSDAQLPLEAVVTSKKDLEDMVKVEKSRAVGSMLVMSGNTQTCKVKIGQLLKIKFPEKMEVDIKEVDTFLVTEVTHRVDQAGHYQNSFTGILSDLDNIPMSPVSAPVANPQIAWVKTNEDDKMLGRVKVQFQWQKKDDKTTNWIRVQATDAGKSDKVPKNRGLVTVPEKDDIVMIGFEYGDPNRPFVMGSIFSEKVSKGGDVNNKIKSYTTRVDSSVTFNDEEGSITIKDQQGADSTMTFDGKQNIHINAEKSILLTSGESSILMQADGTINITGVNITINGSANAKMLSGGAQFDATAKGNKANVTGTTTTVHGGDTTTISGQTKTTVTAVGPTIIDGAVIKLN